MSWIAQRLLALLLSLVVASLCGLLVGALLHAPGHGAVVGVGFGAIALFVVDTLRAHRLMRWLRGAQEGAAPRGRSLWGELGYRVERALRTQQRLRTQEREQLQQFLSAIDASPNGVLLLDLDDRIDWCNSVAADHLGLDPERDRRQHITNLVRAPAFVAHLQQRLFGDAIAIPRPDRDGTLAIIVRPYGDGLKLVITQDVTERERAEAMRRDFVANVSHEIRTPLTVLSGFVETLSNLPLTEVERRRVLTLMGQQTLRMQTLVADLLQMAQLEGSPRPPSDRWVPVEALMQRVQAEAVGLSAGRHALNFTLESRAAIAGSDAELQSALANLVNNAVRYTPEGGRIDVGWRLRPDGIGEFEVRDTGIGIEREHLPRLTERFYRVDGSRSRETGGTGLGLSIVKHVVQRHGGELDVQSEPGKGSSFRLLFPAPRVREAAAGEPATELVSRAG
jgi:two-component system phosphate regulon sensor histidine kinase PhoR